MKSLLVDALRQAKNGESPRALSDSGSFDTADNDFGKTANDEVVDGLEPVPPDEAHPPSDRAGIIEDTNSAPKKEGAEDVSARDESQDRTVAGDAVEVVDTVRQAPVLSRLSPFICAVLALIAAASWLSFHNLGLHSPAGDGRIAPTSVDRSQADSAKYSAESSDADRFPYIGDATFEPSGKNLERMEP